METQQGSGTVRTVALITGASSGLGAEFARALAARGHDLILVARRRGRLEELSARLSALHGIEARVVTADLSVDQDVELVTRCIDEERRLELLINNAGFGATGLFHETGPDIQMRMHRLHVLATVAITHAALRKLLPRNQGGVINVASVAGLAHMPGHAGYSSTKAWMIAFSECLHLEMRSMGFRVRIQALCPGYTYTEFHDVLGLDRKVVMPRRGFWMTAEFVVAASLRGFDNGDWLVIPGWRYRMLARLLRVLPRPLLHPIVSRVARRRESAISESAGH